MRFGPRAAEIALVRSSRDLSREPLPLRRLDDRAVEVDQ